MISTSELDALLAVLKKNEVNVFRYKMETEEIEVIIPGGSEIVSEKVSDEDTKNTSGAAKLNLIGFRAGEGLEDDEED